MNRVYTVLILMLGLISCEVEVENPNTITTGTFWKSEADAQKGINAVYNMFYKPGLYTRWIWFRTDLTSDEGGSSSPWAELKEWTRFQYNNYNFWEGNSWTFRDSYQMIYRANQVLKYVPDIAFSDENEKNRVLGQAYFMRGLSYYNLAVLWGGPNSSLPIILNPSQPGDTPGGHSETEVFEQAIGDFEMASNWLPASWPDNQKGRATKGAALAMKAKCHMQLHQWDNASTDLAWLVDGEGSSIYGLVANYADNFSKDTENNVESVFEIQYSDIHKAPAGDGDFDVDPNLGHNRGQFFAPPGIGWTDGELRYWVVEEFKKELDLNGNFDIRLRHTAFYEGMNADFPNNNRIYRYRLDGAEQHIWNEQNWKGRVFMRKYGSDNYRDFDDYHNPINIRLIRYADVLLMYAECIANTGAGDLQKAVSLVNRVRARVQMPELAINHADAANSKTAFLKRLQFERTSELCSEGVRWPDLKRWGLLDSEAGLNELRLRDSDFNNFIVGKHNRMPIPSTEVGNNPNITQNPQY